MNKHIEELTIMEARIKSEPEVINLEATKAFASEVHNYVSDYIKFADQKAAFIFTILSAALAFVCNEYRALQSAGNSPEWGVQLLTIAAILGLLGGAVSAALAVWPRGKGAVRALVFWKAIARFETKEKYAAEVSRQRPSDLTTEMLSHCHELAENCQIKYRWVQRAFLSGSVGLIATVMQWVFLIT